MKNHRFIYAARAGLLALLCSPTLVGCSAGSMNDEGESPDTVNDPLVNARALSKDPAVGVVTTIQRPPKEQTQCTGTLIGRRTILTAAHCARTGEVVSFCSFPCGNQTACAGKCRNGVVQRFPGYSGEGDWDRDAAIIKLDSDFVAAFGIMPYLIGGPAQEGESLTLIGYGCSVPDSQVGVGQQRIGENTLNEVHDDTIEYDDESKTFSCRGDSGGPAALLNCEVGMTLGMSDYIIDKDYELSRVSAKVGWIKQNAGDPGVHECGNTVCGDGLCQFPETNCGCPLDCSGKCPPPPPPPKCGDGVCNGTETLKSCPGDCPEGTCSAGKVDCCSDGKCLTLAQCAKITC